MEVEIVESTTLVSVIDEVTSLGEVKISFSENIIVPENISAIDSSVMTVDVSYFFSDDGTLLDPDGLNFSWNLTSIDEEGMVI